LVVLSFVNAICWPAMELDRQLANVFFWATILPHMAAAVRRLHDTGRSGWYLLVGSIPFIGWIALAFLLLQDSKASGDDDGFAAA
jgi:uncharacterized membrane protein YhaH (DUF805 family)